jgi:rsbT co-antagonist protein RsbR
MEDEPKGAAGGDLTATYDKIAEILSVLSDVAKGEYGHRLASNLPDGHPLAALCTGINDMIASLAAEQELGKEYRRELEEKLATIDQQRAAIRELSTPVMEVWDGILCLPVIGIMDSSRSADMTDALLKAVVSTRARCAIVDITGIEVMDTRTADHFIRMAKAVRLLGADCVLTGLNPQIAQTVVHMGVELEGLVTHRSLRDALTHYIDKKPAKADKDRPHRGARDER